MRGILDEVAFERDVQREEFGVSDTRHSAEAWIARLVKHTGRAVTLDPQAFRYQMIRVAAIAVAAVEWYDRKYGAR